MRIGKPVIMAVTPKGPPNSYLLEMSFEQLRVFVGLAHLSCLSSRSSLFLPSSVGITTAVGFRCLSSPFDAPAITRLTMRESTFCDSREAEKVVRSAQVLCIAHTSELERLEVAAGNLNYSNFIRKASLSTYHYVLLCSDSLASRDFFV